ncbi:MAG: potassium transporter TrkG [Leptospirales bacterium]
MNFRVLSTLLGLLIGILAFFLLIFTLVAFFFYSSEYQAGAFFESFLTTLVSAIILILWGGKVSEENVTFREGFAVVGLGWIVIAFFGALPFYFSGDIPSFTDAYFESMSGYTTTGSSILSSVENLGHTVLLWRSFSHWLGGMGFIVLSLAILPALGVGGMQLYKAEVPGPSPDKLMPRVGQTARILYMVYSLLTILQFSLLWAGGMNIFESLCHTFGTMGTGGFSPLNGSIGQYTTTANSSALYFEVVIIVFMFIAGANFSLHYRAMKGDWKVYFADSEFRFYFILVLLAIFTISLDLYNSSLYDDFGEVVRHSSFSVVSIITTTGYGTENFDLWPNYSRFLLVFLMFIGGMAGSTGGGIKVLRIMTIMKEAIYEISHIIHPKKVYSIRFGKTYIHRDVLSSMNMYVIVFLILYVLGILILSTTGYDFETVSTMVVACFANIGPGLGRVGPTENYGFLPDYAKWVLSYLMVLGRLELFPLLVLSLPGIWTK